MMMNNRASRRSKFIAYVVWIIIMAVFVGYMYQLNKKKNRANIRKETALSEQLHIDDMKKLSEIVIRTGAIYDWGEKLYQGDWFSDKSIFTYELENLWIQQAPILFIGDIKDIATYDQEHYLVIMQGFEIELMMSDTRALQLSLVTKKDLIDSFFNEHPDVLKNRHFNESIAVVARINSIRTIYEPRDIGHEEREIIYVEIKVGDGELIEIVHITSDVSFGIFIPDLRKTINEYKTSF